MAQQSPRVALPNSIAEKLHLVQGRSLKVRLATAIVAALVVLLAAMGVAMLVDYLATLYDSRWRVFLTATALATAAATLVVWALAGWRYTRRLDRSAAAVDREFPELEERWTTVASLAESPRTAADVDPGMFRKVSAEATRWSPRVEPAQVVSLDGLIRALLGLTAVTAILGIAVILDARQTTVLMRRFWAPQSLISATVISHVPGDVVIGRGEPFEIGANFRGALPSRATLMLEPAAGESQTITLVPHVTQDAVRVSHRVRAVTVPVKYRFRAGDGQTPWYTVAVADRPKIAGVRLTVTPPAYAHKAAESWDQIPRRITALEGSQFELALRPETPVASVQLRLGPERAEQLTRGADGWYRWSTNVEQDFTLAAHMAEEHGLTNDRPPVCKVICQPDRPPVVKVLTPHDDVAVRPDDKLKITFVAKDDVGIGSAELVVFDESMGGRGKPLPLKTIPIPLDEQVGAESVRASVELDLSEFNLADGAQLSYAIRVRESRGQATPANQRAGSPPVEANGQPASESLAQAGDQQLASANPAAADQSTEPVLPSDNQSAATPSPASNSATANPAAAPTSSSAPSASTTTQASPAGGRSSPAATDQPQPPSGPQTGSDEQTVSTGQPTPSLPTDQMPNAQTAAARPAAQPGGSQSPQSGASGQPQANQSAPPNESQQASYNPGSRAAQSGSAGEQRQPSSGGSPPPDGMAQNSVDLPARSSASQQMRVKVDQWAGSFEGQQREKLELVIAPLIAELDRTLEKAQTLSRIVLDETPDPAQWRAKQDRDVSQAEKRVVAATKIITDLEGDTNGTPYAFIGLQLVDINQAHIEPARREFWKSLQTDATGRVDAVRNGWQHTGRARELVAMLTERFERARREYALAESVEQIKKMHRIFLEESMALLQPPADDNGGYSRKPVEFDLDEEYLARLKEVLEMREQMRKELARILRDDPRLLRRFLDAQRNRQNNMRHELGDLVEDQREINRETKAWTAVEESQRSELASILLGRHVEGSQEVAVSAVELLETFETWLPLQQAQDDKEVQAVAQLLGSISGSARELTAGAADYVTAQLPPVAPPAVSPEEGSPAGTEPMTAPQTPDPAAVLARIDAEAERLYDELVQLEVSLRQLGLRSDRLDMANFATNRLVETRRLIAQSSGWVKQLREQQAGNYHRSAEVSQYQVAQRTEALVAKLADIETTLANLLEIDGTTLPPSIAEKAREMFAIFDEQVSPNQQAAIYALRRNQMSRATTRQSSALAGLELAAQKYDEMIRAAIEELDKLPVQDPIASLLDDPTLDELLAELEQELPVEELVGIPRRSSNLQIQSDFLRAAGDNGIMTGGNGMRLMNQLREQQRLRQRQLDRAYRRAVARAMKEADAEDLVKDMPLKLAGEGSDWNVLLSELGDDLRQGRDKAPPERYRRAIEQYFRQISRSADAEP